MRALTVSVLCMGVFAACGGNGVDPRGPLKSGALRYRAFSALGRPLLSGSLVLVAHEDSSVTGTWAIRWVVGADTTTPVGPQVGEGTLSGRQLSDGTVDLNLNPLYADNNVFLSSAPVTATGLSGKWSWSGFAGPLANGRFQAEF